MFEKTVANISKTIDKSVHSLFSPIRSVNDLALDYAGKVAGSQLISVKSVSDITMNQMTAVASVEVPKDMTDLGTYSFKTSVALNQAVVSNAHNLVKMGYHLQTDFGRLLIAAPMKALKKRKPAVVIKNVRVAQSRASNKSNTINVIESLKPEVVEKPVQLVSSNPNIIPSKAKGAEVAKKPRSKKKTMSPKAAKSTASSAKKSAVKIKAKSKAKDKIKPTTSKDKEEV